MSSKDPLASVAEGATKGFLEYTEDKAKEFITKFLNRKLAFVQDVETINTVKDAKRASEYKYFQQYISNSDYRILFQLGLTLRRFEKDNKRLTLLRDKIVLKYGEKGLHIAQFVQNGLVGKYVGNILEVSTIDPKDLPTEIEKLFGNIENIVNYIEQLDNVDKKVKEIVTKMLAYSPRIYVICSTKSAMELCHKILERVMKEISNYEVELYKTDIKEVYFLKRTPPKTSSR
jgi:hypothetical protein